MRWETAANGQIAVEKWKTGGFHLILMDIQMPVMDGLQATKAIRQLEREQGIGVFSDRLATTVKIAEDVDSEKGNEAIARKEGFIQSPVIIVALTASSLEFDRSEALAAGCNDFITKPVKRAWLNSKIMEWGCMQALVSFDGWQQWRADASRQKQEP